MAWVALSSSTQDVATGFTNVYGNLDLLRSCFIGSSAPATPVAGQLWLDTSGTPFILKLYSDFTGGGATWNEVAVGAAVSSDMEFGFNQAKEMRVENLAADESVVAGKDGFVFFHTGVGEIKFVDQSVDAAVKTVCAVRAGVTTDKILLPLAAVGLDATHPPTAGTKGTTPTVRGYLFDATNELLSFAFVVPANWSADGNMTLKLACLLNQAETNGDDIDWSADVETAVEGEAFGGTSTAAAASLTDIGTNSLEGTLHICDVTIDYDDATNPVSAGGLVVVEIHRTDLAEVGGVILVAAWVEYAVDGAVQ